MLMWCLYGMGMWFYMGLFGIVVFRFFSDIRNVYLIERR